MRLSHTTIVEGPHNWEVFFSCQSTCVNSIWLAVIKSKVAHLEFIKNFSIFTAEEQIPFLGKKKYLIKYGKHQKNYTLLVCFNAMCFFIYVPLLLLSSQNMQVKIRLFMCFSTCFLMRLLSPLLFLHFMQDQVTFWSSPILFSIRLRTFLWM